MADMADVMARAAIMGEAMTTSLEIIDGDPTWIALPPGEWKILISLDGILEIRSHEGPALEICDAAVRLRSEPLGWIPSPPTAPIPETTETYENRRFCLSRPGYRLAGGRMLWLYLEDRLVNFPGKAGS